MNPLLRDLAVPITTDRLLLRPPQAGDGPIINKAVVASFKELQRWLPWAQQKPTVNDSESWCRQSVADWALRKQLPLLIFNHDNAYLGGTGFNNVRWDIPCVEIGYWISTEHTGNGYAREAVNALTRYAFEHLEVVRLAIRCDEDNTKSRQIPLSLGYKEEALLRNFEIKADGSGPMNVALYARFDLKNLPDLEVAW